MHDYLKALIANKRKEIDTLRAGRSSELILSTMPSYSGKKSFKQSLMGKRSVIAEIKRRSPSKFHIGDIVDPVSLAKQYLKGGAAAISVLTDSYGFGGSIADLKEIATFLENSPCPVLQKDFMLDPIQISEAIVAGADAVLLIVAVLGAATKVMLDIAKQSGIDAIVEIHDQKECDYAVSIGAEVIGVNNRNLTTFEIHPNCALQLIDAIPDGTIKIAESGMSSAEAAKVYLDAGYHAVLIGEALVRSGDPAAFIRDCHE